jgi:hypothetical protein
MQNSELFRRGVVLPLDERAEEDLRCNSVNSTTHAQYLPIRSDTLFEKLWEGGFFHEINKWCGTLIDDHEEEFIEASSLPRLIAALDAIAERASGTQSDVQGFLVELRQITIYASRLNRPLLFVL